MKYDERARRVQLDAGEALFEVSKRHDWPFIVTAGGHEIRALGTSFVVRRDNGRLAVTLVDGKVTVSGRGAIHRAHGPGQHGVGSEARAVARSARDDF